MKTITFLTNEVAEHIVPVIRDFFIDVYEHPENFLEPDQKDASNQLIKFQMALKKIPNWTNTQIKKNIDEINNRCNWFKQLLVALFIAHVKMIKEGIRTSAIKKKLDIKLPSDETFVHTCFVTCAHNLYEDPYIMKENERTRNEELDSRLHKCVLKSIYKLIPTREIIISELNEQVPEEATFNEPEPETDPIGEEEEEPKTVQMTPSSSPQETTVMKKSPLAREGEEEDVGEPESRPDLFPDAPDDKKPIIQEENDLHK